NIILMYWEYTPRDYYKNLDKLLDAGFKVIVSPSMLNWCRNFPDNIHASKNIINLTKQGVNSKDRGVIGMLNSIWGDQHYYSFRDNTIFGGVLGASVSWNSKLDIYKDIVKTYGFLFYGLEEKHLENDRLDYALCSGLTAILIMEAIGMNMGSKNKDIILMTNTIINRKEVYKSLLCVFINFSDFFD
ncbi:unnamed protein product, partial [marine sediment metagenome]